MHIETLIVSITMLYHSMTARNHILQQKVRMHNTAIIHQTKNSQFDSTINGIGKNNVAVYVMHITK